MGAQGKYFGPRAEYMPPKYLVALKKTRVTNVKKVGKFKSGGAIWIRMCECNFKKSKFGDIFWVCVCLKSVGLKKTTEGASLHKGRACPPPFIRLEEGLASNASPLSCLCKRGLVSQGSGNLLENVFTGTLQW